MNSIEFQGTTLQVGQRVRISNGEPMPPARFKRKLAAWLGENWTGTIEEVQAPSKYRPHGGIATTNDRHPDTFCMVYRAHVMLGGRLVVELLEEHREYEYERQAGGL